jgi:gamma-glutamylcyclotransferase (GGCT)/AIG2-like uncharacterized protein YtfP
VFASPDPPEYWTRLDALEGDEYRRVLAPVETSGGTVEAWVYVLAVPS